MKNFPIEAFTNPNLVELEAIRLDKSYTIYGFNHIEDDIGLCAVFSGGLANRYHNFNCSTSDVPALLMYHSDIVQLLKGTSVFSSMLRCSRKFPSETEEDKLNLQVQARRPVQRMTTGPGNDIWVINIQTINFPLLEDLTSGYYELRDFKLHTSLSATLVILYYMYRFTEDSRQKELFILNMKGLLQSNGLYDWFISQENFNLLQQEEHNFDLLEVRKLLCESA